MKKLTTQNFIQKAKQIHGNKYDYSKVNYKTNMITIKIYCNKCKEYFLQKPNKHLYGQGCANCSGNKKMNTKIFIKKAKQIHGNKFSYDKVNYINSATKIKIYCNKHKLYFNQISNNHLCGQECPKCGNEKIKYKKIKSINNFILDVKKIHGNKYNYSKVEYKGNKIKIIIICKEHGEFLQTPDKHLQGQGCSNCKESKGENIIREWLEKNKINYKCQKRFKNCKDKYTLPFDFYLPEYDILIEYDGKQHYLKDSKYYSKKIIKHDKMKTQFAKNNNIKLLRISYKQFNMINIILQGILL